jgi:hypothetical protein
MMVALATPHPSVPKSPSPETLLRISFHSSWALWPQRTWHFITVPDTLWGDYIVSPDTNHPSGVLRLSMGAQHTLSTESVQEVGRHQWIHWDAVVSTQPVPPYTCNVWFWRPVWSQSIRNVTSLRSDLSHIPSGPSPEKSFRWSIWFLEI